MDPVDRVREARKQTQIAYDDLETRRGFRWDDDVLADLARAERCLRDVIGALEEGDG